jgi:sugar lactone lactonase YvrE
MRRGVLAGMVAALLVAAAGSAAPAKSPNVSLAGRSAGLVAGRPWNAVLAVRGSRPSRVGLTATSGDRRIATSARRWRQGRYRGRLVFPAAGRWTLTARLGRKQFRLGTILVRARGPRPLVLFRPTELALDRDGSLLVVESGDNRVVRVDAGTGRISPLVTAAAPFGLAIAPSGELYVSSGSALVRFDAAGRSSTVARMETDVGPVAVDAAGNVYFTTTTRIFRIRGGMDPVEHIAGTGEVGNGGDGGPAQAAQLDAPHGLVIAGGTLFLSDGGNDRIRRIDLASGIIAPVAPIVGPAGLGLGADGSLLVCEQRANRVLRIHPSGASTVVAGTGRKASTGDGGPATAAALDTPTDVAVASDGTVYVLEGFASGRIRRIDPSGRITTVLRR